MSLYYEPAKEGRTKMKSKVQHVLLAPVKERLANCEDVIYQSLRIHGSTCTVIYIESIVEDRKSVV